MLDICILTGLFLIRSAVALQPVSQQRNYNVNGWGLSISEGRRIGRNLERKDLDLFYQGAIRTDIPQRTDIEPLKKYDHPDNKKFLYGEQGVHCNGCYEHFLIKNLTVDHIIPRTGGGTDHLYNLQRLCGYCNSVKGNRGQEYLIAKPAA